MKKELSVAGATLSLFVGLGVYLAAGSDGHDSDWISDTSRISINLDAQQIAREGNRLSNVEVEVLLQCGNFGRPSQARTIQDFALRIEQFYNSPFCTTRPIEAKVPALAWVEHINGYFVVQELPIDLNVNVVSPCKLTVISGDKKVCQYVVWCREVRRQQASCLQKQLIEISKFCRKLSLQDIANPGGSIHETGFPLKVLYYLWSREIINRFAEAGVSSPCYYQALISSMGADHIGIDGEYLGVRNNGWASFPFPGIADSRLAIRTENNRVLGNENYNTCGITFDDSEAKHGEGQEADPAFGHMFTWPPVSSPTRLRRFRRNPKSPSARLGQRL
jgi:hypothetical protein